MSEYDVIVVGAGASGAALAARLSEDPATRVLVLEAGPAPRSIEQFPADLLDAGTLRGARAGHPNNWSYEAVLTSAVRSYPVARGRIAGGSTALNGTYFIRGLASDFDEFARGGCDRWSWEQVLPSFIKLEHDINFGAEFGHGDDGPIRIRRASGDQLSAIGTAFIRACRALNYPEERDKNNVEVSPGSGAVPVNSLDGVRLNSAITYLLPILGRPNVQVRGDSRVRRVVITEQIVRGVEIGSAQRPEQITAPVVVVSAGAIESPHLLALSGIGPRHELEACGIDLVADIPGVGKGFSDHPQVFVPWRLRDRQSGSGASAAIEVALNFSSYADRDGVGDLEILPLTRPNSGLFCDIGGSESDREMAFIVSLQRPDSRGILTTVSADPDVPPQLDYRYLRSLSDVRRMREGVRAAIAILNSAEFADLFDGLSGLDTALVSDDRLLDDWIAAHLATAIHAAGSCAMGRAPSDGSVVDQYGRVHGINGLRIADTSILPRTTGRGTAATAVMIGERMADLMANDLSAR